MSVGFIGAGRMASAMIRGFINQKMVAPQQIIASDIDGSSLSSIKSLGVWVTRSNDETATKSDILFLSVKPQILPGVLSEIKSSVSNQTLVVSVAAGVTIKSIQDILGDNKRIVRVMPNTPMLIGKGASGFARGPNVTDCDIMITKGFLDSVGLSMETSESALDAVTGVSGSGPSYALTLVESMADGGVKMGLSRQVAIQLAAQTVAGAAEMLLATGGHPAVMRDEIVSPAGTTAHANHALEKSGFRSAVVNAVEAATLRSMELSTLAAKSSTTGARTSEQSGQNNEKISEDLAGKFESLKKRKDQG